MTGHWLDFSSVINFANMQSISEAPYWDYWLFVLWNQPSRSRKLRQALDEHKNTFPEKTVVQIECHANVQAALKHTKSMERRNRMQSDVNRCKSRRTVVSGLWDRIGKNRRRRRIKTLLEFLFWNWFLWAVTHTHTHTKWLVWHLFPPTHTDSQEVWKESNMGSKSSEITGRSDWFTRKLKLYQQTCIFVKQCATAVIILHV